MAIPVIKVPAQPVRLRLGSLSLNEFDKVVQLVLVQVDDKGEQVKGGVQVPGRSTGTDYDDDTAVFTEGVVGKVLARMIANGQIDKDSVVELLP